MDFLRSRQSFSTTPAYTITWTDGQVKIAFSHQHSAPSLIYGMLHTIARRDTMLRDCRSADIHGLGPRSDPTGGDFTGGDPPVSPERERWRAGKPHKRSNKVFRDQASPKQFDQESEGEH